MGTISLFDYNETTAFWSFIIYCLVVIFVAVFFLFYSNRIFAQALSKLIRWYTWHYFKAYIEFESLQIAPLGGRILFRNFRYHSTNQSITILHGYITFRYWLWNVRTEDDTKSEDATEFSKSFGMADQDDCRITVNTVGLEWFMYNRTPAYDVLAQTLGLNPDASPFTETRERSTVTVDMTDEVSQESSEMQDKWFRRALPIKIVCDTGAIIMGNAHLPSLLVASFPSAHSMYSVTKARSSLDPYKTVLLVTFDTPSIDFRPNADYNTDITGRNMGSVPNISQLPPEKPSRVAKLTKPLRDLWTHLFGVTRKEAEEWHGLPRYSQNVSTDQLKNSQFEEYAMVRNILQCTALGLRYSTDTAGRVPAPSTYGSDADYDLPPEWSIELIIDEAVISYGPWADRQRAEMQNFFFPNSYRTLDPTESPKPGQLRVHVALQIMVTFSSSVTFKIPTKEKSKDWKYDDSEYQRVQGGKSTRPYGWLELKAQTGSTISVDIPMVYGPEGYKNVVLVDLQGVGITSSINYAPMVDLKDLKMVCQLHNPLVWNAQRNWDFELTLDTPKIFILRDHITLIQDLSRDWTTGPPVEMAYFVPFKYKFDLKLPNFQLYTYVNEHNIINEPTEQEENAFIIASGQSLECNVILPFLYYNPEMASINFDVEILNGGLEIQLPLAHTLGEFLTPESRKFATIPSVNVKGTYKYYDFVDPNHLESLDLDVKGDGVTVKLFGSVIRYVLILMDNYAGLFINFVTFEEYRYQRDNPGKMEAQERKQANAKPPSDPYEVYVNFVTTDTTLILPENLYSCENYSQITCSELQIELRNLDVYMDMHVNISPLTWSRDTIKDVTHRGQKAGRGNQNYLYIDGVTVYAHRLFGPLPKTTTYVANWKLDIGTIYGQIKPSFLLGVTSFAKAFAYNLVDGDNALPPEYATVTPPDITIVDLSVKEIDVSVWGADVVSQILLKDGVVVHFDDIMNERYLSRIVLKLPSLLVRSLALTEVSRDDQVNDQDRLNQDQWPWVELANLNCAFDITVYQGAADWRERRAKQQAFVKAQDSETRRCPFIYSVRGEEDESRHHNLHGNHFGTLYVPPLTFDPEALREGRDVGGRSNRTSMVGSMSGGGSIVEILSEDEAPRQLHQRSFNRSTSSFSILGGASDDGHDSEYGSQIDDWEEDTSNPDLDYSSSDDGGEELVRSDIDVESVRQEAVEEEEAPSIHARSIPYSTYLKRYAILQNLSGYHANPYMPPPRVIFNQSKLRDILDDVPRHHPNANFEDAFEEKLANAEGVSSAHPQGEDNSQEKRTTVIVDATQDVKVLLTPILLKIIQEFLEAINAEEWDLETMLDVTQMEYVELLTRMQPSKLHSQRFAVNIPRIHLRFIQDVMMPDTLNSGDDINVIKTRYELSGSSTNLCAVDIVLDDTAVIAAVKYEDEEFEKFVPGKIHIASFKVVESRTNFDFSMLKLNARFVSGSTTRIFGIPDSRHQFSRLDISHLSFDNEPVIADITFKNFMLRLVRSSSPNHFLMQLDKFSVIFINQSAEIVAGAICSWLTFVKDLNTILTRFQLRRSKQLQTLFSEIAKYSVQENLNTDPVFLTRPSTTLRLGTLFYRNDDGWKLLAHIRHCMREISDARRSNLQNMLKKSELEEYSTDAMYTIVINVFQNWRSWEIDDLRQCRLFSDVFERKRMPSADPLPNVGKRKESQIYDVLRYSENSVQLRLGEFEGAIYDEQQENSLNVTNLEFVIESRFKPGILAHVGLFPGMPVAGDTSRLSAGYLDVAVKAGLGNASVVVNPVVIAFIKHILRVERIFRPQFNKGIDLGPAGTTVAEKKSPGEIRFILDGAGSPRQSLHFNRDMPTSTAAVTSIAENEPNIKEVLDRFDIVFNGMVVVETILITMHAQNLTAKVIFSQIQASALNFAQQRSLPHYDPESISVAKSSGSNPDTAGQRSGSNRLIGSIVSNISSINSTLLERIFAKEGSVSVQQERELLTFGIVGLNSDVTLSLFTPPKKTAKTKGSPPREVINILVTFKQVGITLPRSVLKLYLFAKDWREENMKSFDFLFQGVMDEWEADRRSRPQPKVAIPPSVPRELKVQMILKTFTLESHMLPSLLFQYEAGDLMVMLHDIPPGLAGSTPRLTYNVQLLRQTVDFLANQKGKGGNERHRLLEDKHAASFTLPVIRASGSMMSIMDATTASRARRSSITALTRDSRMPKKLDMSVSLDFVELTLNVGMLDNLLTAQSLLGAEVNELIDMLSKTSRPASTSTATSPNPSAPPRPPSKPELLYFVKVSLVGLSIAAVSPSAILYFESDLLKGVMTNNPDSGPSVPIRSTKPTRLAWRVHAQNVTLSLNHHLGQVRAASRAEDSKARKLRLAYLTINLNVQNFSPNRSDKDRFAPSNVSPFYVSFLKIHSLMQPQSVSRMIGLYTYYVHELDRRKELKAAEMARLADNTKRIMKTLDVEVPAAYKDNTRSMLEAIEIYLTIDDVAVAIPLDRREDVMSSSERLVEAFLISATSIQVLTKSGEKSSGTLNNLCAQFVHRFDQSKDEHFRSRHHSKINRLTFPSISCKVDAYKESTSVQHISSEAFVSGFELDIDPSIVRYITTLNDVYDNSKVLVTSLSLEGTGANATAATGTASISGDSTGGAFKSPPFLDPSGSTMSTPKIEIPAAPLPSTDGMVVIWKVENTFQCSKSVCRFYPKNYAMSRGGGSGVGGSGGGTKTKSNGYTTSKSSADASGVDQFVIPGLSLWTSLKIPVSDSVADLQAAGPARLHAEINVHSSENTFYPSLVPFFQDIVSGLKVGIRRPRAHSNPKMLEEGSLFRPSSSQSHASLSVNSNQSSPSETSSVTEMHHQQQPQHPLSHSASSTNLVSVGKKQDLAVTVYMFLEKTRIEFNCQPTAKVMSVLTFEQGNILTSYNSDRTGNTTLTFAGKFQGASSETRHIFSQDKGFKLETKAITFNAVAETRTQQLSENNKKTLSVFIDFIQFGMDFDLRQSEILVLMKMIWMDQANYLIKDSMTVSRSSSSQQVTNLESTATASASLSPSSSSSRDPESSEASSKFVGRTPNQTNPANLSGQHQGNNNYTQVVAMRESSFLGYNVFVIAQLQQMTITGDLGSQIGKMEFTLDQVRVRIKLRPFHPRSLSVSTGALNLQFLSMDRGWLEGYLTMEGVHLESVAKVTRIPSFPSSICEVVLVTKKLSSMLSYDYKKILVLEVDPFRVVMQDHWNGPDMDRGDLSLAILAHLQGLRLLAGAKTVPVFKTLFTRLVTLMEQKQSAAHEELKNPPLSPSSLQSPPDTSPGSSLGAGDDDSGNSHSSGGGKKKSLHPMWNAIGRVQLSVQELDLSFFPFLLSDKECTHASVNTVKLSFDRYVIYSDNPSPVIHRLTTVSVGGLSLQKYTLPVLHDANQVLYFTVQQWFERTRTNNAQTIAKLPATSQMMESWQELESHVIEHICKTQFAGLIDIATDYRLFRGVEKNVERFLEEMSIRDHRSADESAAATSAAAATAVTAIDVVAVAAAAAASSSSIGSVPGAVSVSPLLTDMAVVQDPTAPLSAGRNSSNGAVENGQSLQQDKGAIAGSKLKDSPASSTSVVTSATNGSTDEASSSTSLRKGLLISGLGGGGGDEKASPDVNGKDSKQQPFNNVEMKRTVDDKGSKDSKAKTTKTSTTGTLAGTASAEESKKDSKDKALTFKARDSIVFKPALDVLPNTPLPLGQLGFKKEDIPPIVHTLTIVLEDGLLAAAEFHHDKVRVMGLHDLWEGRVKMDD